MKMNKQKKNSQLMVTTTIGPTKLRFGTLTSRELVKVSVRALLEYLSLSKGGVFKF
jgi:hypothetical protein